MKTDEKGSVLIAKHLSGHYHFVISVTDYQEVDLGADVKQGMSNMFSMKMRSGQGG